MKIVKMDYSENAERIPGFLLWQVSKLWQRHLNSVLGDLGVSSTQAIILGNIVRMAGQNKEATQVLLSEVTKVDPMTTSQALRTLEKKKLVRRVASKDDKRAYCVKATAKGVEVTSEALDRMIEAHLSFFKPLEDQLEEFTNHLQQLVKSNEK